MPSHFTLYYETCKLVVCDAARTHGHVSHADKCCPSRWITVTQTPNTHPHPHPPIFTFLSICNAEQLQLHAHESTTSMTISFHSQITCGTSSDVTSDVTPSRAPPIVSFELNQARRANVAGELETLKSCASSTCPKCLTNRSHTRHANSSSLNYMQLS